MANNPRWIGNRDGIPAWARDRANRSLIDTYRAELEQRMQGANARERKILQAKLAGLNKVGAVIGLPGRQLLLLDIERSEQPHSHGATLPTGRWHRRDPSPVRQLLPRLIKVPSGPAEGLASKL